MESDADLFIVPGNGGSGQGAWGLGVDERAGAAASPAREFGLVPDVEVAWFVSVRWLKSVRLVILQTGASFRVVRAALARSAASWRADRRRFLEAGMVASFHFDR